MHNLADLADSIGISCEVLLAHSNGSADPVLVVPCGIDGGDVDNDIVDTFLSNLAAGPVYYKLDASEFGDDLPPHDIEALYDMDFIMAGAFRKLGDTSHTHVGGQSHEDATLQIRTVREPARHHRLRG